MSDLGIHLLLDLEGCPREVLGDRSRIRVALRAAALDAGATIVGEVFHQFQPAGISGVLLLAESHVSVHTWPERQEAALDLYSCAASFDVEAAAGALARALGATRQQRRLVRRGDGIARVEEPRDRQSA